MGILEDIQGSLTLLNQKQDMLMAAIKQVAEGKQVEFNGKTPTIETPETPNLTEESAAPTSAEVIGKGGIDLNTPDATGVVWDERIHSSNQKRTGKNVWSKRKGVSAVDFNKIHAELLASASQVASAPAPSSAPTAPTAPAAPTAPSSAPATPELSPAEQNKKDMLEAMNVLTSKYEMDFDVVLTLLPKFNAQNLDTLLPENFESATRDFIAWSQWLEMIELEVSKINALANGNPEAAKNIDVIYKNGGASSLNTVQFANCNGVHDQMKAYRVSWDEFVASQAG